MWGLRKEALLKRFIQKDHFLHPKSSKRDFRGATSWAVHVFLAFGACEVAWAVGSPAFPEFFRAKDVIGLPVGPSGTMCERGLTWSHSKFSPSVRAHPEFPEIQKLRKSEQSAEGKWASLKPPYTECVKIINTVLAPYFDLGGVRDWPVIGHKVEKKKRDEHSCAQEPGGRGTSLTWGRSFSNQVGGSFISRLHTWILVGFEVATWAQRSTQGSTQVFIWGQRGRIHWMPFKGQRKRKIELTFDQVPWLHQLRVWIIYA